MQLLDQIVGFPHHQNFIGLLKQVEDPSSALLDSELSGLCLESIELILLGRVRKLSAGACGEDFDDLLVAGVVGVARAVVADEHGCRSGVHEWNRITNLRQMKGLIPQYNA